MKLNLRQIRLVTFITALVILVAGAGYWFGSHAVELRVGKAPLVIVERTPPEDKNIDFSLFWDVWDRLSASFIDKKALDAQQMVYGAIRGMVASLNDPYTVFLPPSDNQQVKEDLNGAFNGVGIELGYRDNQLTVISPLQGMPAEKVGVKAGDLILRVEDQETTGMNLPEAVKLIRGPKGTAIKLTLLHQGENEPYEASIIRDTIVVPSVEVEFIDQVAHLKLMRFGDRTSDEWHEVVNQIANHLPASGPIKGVILDLRSNPGGYLSGSVFIASEFLASGVVVQQESANGVKETYSVNRTGRLTHPDLVVLVNQGSASASEIVAGALKYHQRAKIVGEKTFGKGTVQEAQDLADGSGLHITSARWLLPSGESIEDEGVVPDYEIKDSPETEGDEQLDKAFELLAR
ncbi:MAG TPA: S41 family peptidase [Nevskiaceae bacterium]|nr:S41 family peptidase [Nevskiaceae bacterium]